MFVWVLHIVCLLQELRAFFRERLSRHGPYRQLSNHSYSSSSPSVTVPLMNYVFEMKTAALNVRNFVIIKSGVISRLHIFVKICEFRRFDLTEI